MTLQLHIDADGRGVCDLGRSRMHRRLILALLILWPFLAVADVKWHEFGVSEGEKQTIKLGDASLTIETRPVDERVFKEDYLLVSVRRAGHGQGEHSFTSSYGTGAVAVYGDILLLKYGVERGTSARVEHVKALALTRSLEELFDIQTSSYVSIRDSKRTSPDYVEHRLRITTTQDYTTFTFTAPDSREGIPPEKIVKLKK